MCVVYRVFCFVWRSRNQNHTTPIQSSERTLETNKHIPSQLREAFSYQECVLLFENVQRYLHRKLRRAKKQTIMGGAVIVNALLSFTICLIVLFDVI